MTYLIRSLKYFVTMSIFAIILIVLMILTGFATVDLYEPGSAWRFVVLFGAIAVISLFHPKMTRTVRYVAGNLSNEGKPIVLNAFREADYELVSEKEGVLTFRARTFFLRLRRFFDDGITIAQEGDRLRIEGQRIGVFRVLHHWDAYTSYVK